MLAGDYQSQASALLAAIDQLTTRHLMHNGDTAATCQQVAIQQAIQALQARINGVDQTDMMPE